MSFQVAINSADDWKVEMATPGYLQVIDIYHTWCGPCKAIQNTFKKIYLDYGDKPLKFYTVAKETLPEELKQHASETGEPAFLLMQDNEVVKACKGVNVPVLQKAIMEGLGIE
mmetsp:Transcript_19692/g.67022  ORF Transcript_19692/g.67022 Transcript_19692/m.67022 type:complete len:113 (-) Transcript_19692:1050-1388(-)